MAGTPRTGNARPVGDIATGILDPVLRKKAGISTGLVQSWEEIVGERLASRTRPEKIAWPRRSGEDDPFEPATLIVACEGSAALHLQHETGEIIARINAFLGFAAVARIKIVQKPVARERKPAPRPPRALSPAEAARIAGVLDGIEDDALRASLERLGRTILGSKR
ncbi:MAG: DciA family protein [Mesorhizobium sp.]|nr:DciA family protein [Mesorhizobium sp.]